MLSHEDERARSMQMKINELEALVGAACSRGVEAARCRDIIEDVVRRARRKGAMLPHLDSALLLSTLEQAKSEIAGLTDVALTNAEVMKDELMHHTERAEERAPSEDVGAASVASVPGSSAAPSSVSAFSVSEEREQRGQRAANPGSAADEGPSPGDALSGAGSAGSGGGLAQAPRTPHAAGALGPTNAVACMRDFASQVAAEAEVEAEEERAFRHTLSMRAPNRGEIEKAASYDFDQALSPRASYHTREELRLSGDSGEHSFGGGGWAEAKWERAAAEAAAEVDFDDSVIAEGAAEGQEEEEEEGEEEAPLLVYSRTPEVGVGRLGEREVEEEAQEAQGEEIEGAPEEEEPSVGLGHEATLAPWAYTRGGSGSSHGSGSAASPRCWGGMPPGFNPLASIEGSAAYGDSEEREPIDPASPTGMGSLDLLSYSSAPFILHSVTPPRHVMKELAAEMQSRLQL